MRGFTKAAALLSSALTSAFVIPDSGSLSSPSSDTFVEYRPYDAFLRFAINTTEPIAGYPIFTFQVESSDKACGDSKILLNGQQLESEWDGTRAHGRDLLDGGNEAEWHVTCLYDVVPSDGSNSIGEDVVHVISLSLLHPVASQEAAFTISYKQLGKPTILRFRLGETDLKNIELGANLWRTPSLQFDPDIPAPAHEENLTTFFIHAQKSLGAHLNALKSSLKAKIHKLIEHLPCHTHIGLPKAIKEGTSPQVSSDRLLEPPQISHDELLPSTLEGSDSTSTIPNLSASETRSLTSPETIDPSATLTHSISSPHSPYDFQSLKIFGLVLILGTCFAWIFLRCRDPRRRADFRAHREEHRNRILYRKAARKHKLKTWYWNFRLRYGLVPRATISWDEKRARVIQQETVLEDVMIDDIRALRNAHRVVSNITLAEEGRTGLLYGSEGSEHMRSMSTLPGYESEGSQPPSYDDADESLGGATVVNGFRYTPAETEFTPDSSVISTSPRTSRDGTNSDFDEKFEPISLEASGPTGSGR